MSIKVCLLSVVAGEPCVELIFHTMEMYRVQNVALVVTTIILAMGKMYAVQ